VWLGWIVGIPRGFRQFAWRGTSSRVSLDVTTGGGTSVSRSALR
jgi:hypothetical protein